MHILTRSLLLLSSNVPKVWSAGILYVTMLCPVDVRLCNTQPPSAIQKTSAFREQVPLTRCEGRSERCARSAELRRQPCSSARRQQRSAVLAARLVRNLTRSGADSGGVGGGGGGSSDGNGDGAAPIDDETAAVAQRSYFESTEGVGSWCPAILGISTAIMADGEEVRVSTPDHAELAIARYFNFHSNTRPRVFNVVHFFDMAGI